MNKSKSLYKNDLPNFARKTSFDIKSFQGLNPQIFTIQAQSFINQNFFHGNGNVDLLHDKSNHFISNLRRLSQKKLKSERNLSDLNKMTNKSSSSFGGTSVIDGLPKKYNIRMNTSVQNRDPCRLENKSQKTKPIDLKKIEAIFVNLLTLPINSLNTQTELDEFFVGLFERTPKTDNNSVIFHIFKNFVEKSLGIISDHSNEIKDLKEAIKECVRIKDEELNNYLEQISELKKSLEIQTHQIDMLQSKEKQLIQFLLAIKSRGVIDLEGLFNEEFNFPKTLEPKKLSTSVEKTTKSRTLIPGKSVDELSQEADISIINDSEESSFNYFGKSETSGQITPMTIIPKFHENKKMKAMAGKFKLNLKDIQTDGQDNQDKKEDVLPSEENKQSDEEIEVNLENFKKKKVEKTGNNEVMKENLLEKLRNFRKVYEKLSKK